MFRFSQTALQELHGQGEGEGGREAGRRNHGVWINDYADMEGKILDMTNPMFKEEQTSRKINTVVEELNKNPFGAQVMLLFLVAVGVGLNLLGANHLFLLDMYWNPQLLAQACDRVYKVGQTREVKIHR